jgi:NitT/TauT family transport system permease protein
MNISKRKIILPAITFVLLIVAWQLSIDFFKIPNYLLPSPKSVLHALYLGYVEGSLWKHMFYTLQSTVLGYVIGCGLAIMLGAALAEFDVLNDMARPYVIALQSMPKVALAPLIIVWFGFGIESKIVMVALVCFFPVFVNTVVGLRETNSALLDLMHAFSASRWHIFTRIKLPGAASHIFAGLQISIVLSLIGAVVAEFVSSTRGLGYVVNSAQVNMAVDTMFAALISLAVLGIVGSFLIGLLQSKVVFWNRQTGSTTMDTN